MLLTDSWRPPMPDVCALCGRDPALGFAEIDDKRYCLGGGATVDCYDRKRLTQELTRLCNEATAERAKEILDRSDFENRPIEVGDDQVVLLGFEDQVDAVWTVNDRPEVLLRPVPLSRRQLLNPPADPTTPDARTARYRRIGEFTYRRES